jgi:hypothetical protein
MRFAERLDHFDTTTGGNRLDLPSDATLPDARRALYRHHRPPAPDRTIQRVLQHGYLVLASDQPGVASLFGTVVLGHGQ